MASDQDSKKKPLTRMNTFAYDVLLWLLSVNIDLFFREIHPRSSWKIPRKGPVIFVAAPHANQFVDPLILARTIRVEARRRVAWLIAAKSMDRQFIGTLAGMMGSVPVGRAMDLAKSAKGKIYLPDPDGDSKLLRGVGTDFEKDAKVGGLVVLPKVNNESASGEIAEIISAEELRLKKPFKEDIPVRQLTGKFESNNADDRADGKPKGEFQGISFKIAPKVDQTEVYDAVFATLNDNGCVGIYPEGGSHDRTDLLPLKAGVAIMALGALAGNPSSGLKIIPCGMNYFHAHKFRSRAVIEFGNPVEVPNELVEGYKAGGDERRKAIGNLLDMVYQGLASVTVQAPDYETLMLIQAVRRLYNPKGKKLPLPMVVELNRRLVKGYKKYKNDPRLVKMKKDVISYNRELLALHIRDHQVEYARMPIYKVIFFLFYRLAKISLLFVGVFPGLLLFSPVFITGKIISIKKSKEALAASSVKVKARDVVATWKLLVAMALAPALYTIYTILLTAQTHRNRVWGYVPDWVPLWVMILFGYVFFPAITYAALRFGEIGMDIIKSLRPLILCLNPATGNPMVELRAKRAALAVDVTELINTFGPEMFPDFDHARIIADPFKEKDEEVYKDEDVSRQHHRQTSEFGSFDAVPDTPSVSSRPDYSLLAPKGNGKHDFPKNMSFSNLGDVGIFATRPATPTSKRSRTRTSSGPGLPLKALSTIDSDGGADELNKRIRGAMRERSSRRRSGQGNWELAESEVVSEADTEPVTPTSTGFKKDQ